MATLTELQAHTNAQGPPAKKRKLTGRAFYEHIGSPSMVLAPMVDQSEFAWRKLTRSYMPTKSRGALLAYTPMFHARLFSETQKFRDHHFQPVREGLKDKGISPKHDVKYYLDGDPKEDRPLFVQFCANNPDELLEAARYVEPYCDAVDLNLGCPQGIARKGNYGAFLQEDQALIARLIGTLSTHLEVPVTAKMRILESKQKTLQYARVLLDAGASILTVHGRQREQKGHKTGLADWSTIRYLRDNLPPETVIFANGNILRYEDISKCLQETGADAVMSAEGNLYDPTIFAEPPPIGLEGHEYWRGRNGKGGYRMDAIFRRYLDILYQDVLGVRPPERKPLFTLSDADLKNQYDETAHHDSPKDSDAQEETGPPKKKQRPNGYVRPTSPNLLAMQPHLFHLLRPLVTKHTHIRDKLAQCRAGDMQAYEQVLAMSEAAIRHGLLDYELDPAKYDEMEALNEKALAEIDNQDESSVATVRACKRPWWVCQPYVRPLPKEALQHGSLTMGKKELKKLEQTQKREEAAKQRQDVVSAREAQDIKDGMPNQEVPQQAMIAG